MIESTEVSVTELAFVTSDSLVDTGADAPGQLAFNIGVEITYVANSEGSAVPGTYCASTADVAGTSQFIDTVNAANPLLDDFDQMVVAALESAGLWDRPRKLERFTTKAADTLHSHLHSPGFTDFVNEATDGQIVRRVHGGIVVLLDAGQGWRRTVCATEELLAHFPPFDLTTTEEFWGYRVVVVDRPVPSVEPQLSITGKG